MTILTICSNKGGQGKTTSALNIAAGLSKKGYKILLIDTDSQSNLTLAMGFSKNTTVHIATLVLGSNSMKDVLKTKDGIDLIPSSVHVAGYEPLFTGRADYQFLLKDLLEPLGKSYDFCIIDTPPSLGALTIASLVASSYMFIPCEPEYFAYEGLSTLLGLRDTLKKHMNPSLEFGGVFFTRYAPSYRKRLHHDMVEAASELVGAGKIMDTTIRENVSIGEAHALKTNIFDYAPDSNGAKDYNNLITELLKRINHGKAKL